MNSGSGWKIAATMLFAALLALGSVAYVIHDRDAEKFARVQQELVTKWKSDLLGENNAPPVIAPFPSGNALLVINSRGIGVVVFTTGQFLYVANTDNYQDPSSKTKTASGPNFRTSLEEPFTLTKIQTASELAADQRANLIDRINRAVDESFAKSPQPATSAATESTK